MDKPVVLGAFLHGFGHHQAAWRHPSTNPDSEFDYRHYVRLAQTAERGMFDLVFLADSTGFRDWERDSLKRMSRAAVLEPLTLLTTLALATEHVGLIATASSTYYQPYQIARLFASIDHISAGRAGWNLVTSTTQAEARNFGLDQQLQHGDRYSRAEEFAGVVKGLWDSWAPDAFLVDKESGIYFDPEKVKALDHKGPHFSVAGPLNIPRSPQGHPIVVQAGSSDAGRDLAAKSADVIFTAHPTLASAQAFYADVKARAAAHGRNPDHVKILPGLLTTSAPDAAEARRKHDEVQALVHVETGLAQLKDLFGGFDLSTYPLDGPLPEIPETEGGKSRRETLVRMARDENLSIRQLCAKVVAARGFLDLVGTPGEIADTMVEWIDSGAADGFNVMAPIMPRDLDDFVELIVPELQARGRLRTSYDGGTLRDRLGLPYPSNPF